MSASEESHPPASVDALLVQRKQFDGIHRIALLPQAGAISVAPGCTVGDTVHVMIAWSAVDIEEPYPGTTIWRAVLERFLANAPDDDPVWQTLKPILIADLERFPSLSAYLQWADHERVIPRDPAREPTRRSFMWSSAGWPW